MSSMTPSQCSSPSSLTARERNRTHTVPPSPVRSSARMSRELASVRLRGRSSGFTQSDILPDRLQRRNAVGVHRLGALPPYEVQSARYVAVDVNGDDHTRAMRESVEEVEREPRVLLDIVAPGHGGISEDAVAKPLLI